MSEATNAGLTKALWLYMVEKGGHWTGLQLARKLRVEREAVDKAVYHMVNTGCASKFPHPGRRNGVAFGVTRQNRVPQQLPLDEVLKAAGL